MDMTLSELLWQWAIAIAFNIALIWLLDRVLHKIFGPDPAERTEGWESRWVKEWSEEE